MTRFVKRILTSIMVTLVIVSLLATAGPVNAGSVIPVNTPIDGISNDGKCSLREAVIAANKNIKYYGCPAGGTGTDTIVIPPNPTSSTFYEVLGTGDDDAMTGDLDIRDSVVIAGAGAGVTTVASKGGDRVFHVINLNTKLVRIKNLTVTGGGAVRKGGAILNQGSRLELVGLVIKNNRTIADNVDAIGGGVSSEYSSSLYPTLYILNTTIMNNTSHSGGGVYSEGELRIERSLIAGNTALTSGGGIDNNLQPGYTATIINTTITGNTAPNGAGIAIFEPLSIYSSTIYDNTGIGLQLQSNGTLAMKNTIIAGHSPAANCRNDSSIVSALVSLGYNMADDTTCNLSSTKKDKIGNPLLDVLANNEGPTWIFALKVGSPAIDGGTNSGCPPVDQRFFVRPADGGKGLICDIGAFEYNSHLLELPNGIFLPTIFR